MTDRILVRFEGDGSGVEELSWGQIGLWQSIELSGRPKTMVRVAALPDGATVDGMAHQLRFMMSRHQALRTRLRLRDGASPLQVCASEGEAVLEVVDAGDTDPAEVATAVSERYQSEQFELETEWPVRFAVIRSGGVLTHQVLVILHTSIDADGLVALLADLDRDDESAPVGLPPLEQARRQQTPAGRKQNATSLEYLEKVLRTVSPSRFGERKYEGERIIHQIEYRSPATQLAIGSVAARLGVNTSPVLLASFAVGLARFTGVNPVLAMLMVSNRFRPGLSDSVSALIQLTPYLIDVADITLDEAVARAARSALTAYKNAYYNPYEQDEVIERVERERGEEIDLSCFYNDSRVFDRGATEPVTAEQIRSALELSTVSWADKINPPKRKIYFNLFDTRGDIKFEMTADSRWFAPADLETIVRNIEAVAVEAALDGSAPTGVGQHVKV
ncbi:MAG TPA: condensation domain-containing protein [Actinophytocola sp.]|uniref:condensation domain-containing protein n=1 Tax=Actinophytocola sp. TaxID=1872138 RepID=UPI002DFC0C02|nr:condensation domain-containing protein [Actinophytocola sp.]